MSNESIMNRSNIKTNNANAFNPNIANPFLVTTYAPPSLAQYARNQAVNEVSTIIAEIVGSLSSVIDFNNFSMTISTILPISQILDPSQSIAIKATTINFNAQTATNITCPLTTINGQVSMPNTLNVNKIFAQDIQFSTASGSTLTVFNTSTGA